MLSKLDRAVWQVCADEDKGNPKQRKSVTETEGDNVSHEARQRARRKVSSACACSLMNGSVMSIT